MSTPTPNRGRPKKSADDKYLTPARQLGRIPDDEWQVLQDAAKSTGQSFTAWARAVLLRAAKRIQK